MIYPLNKTIGVNDQAEFSCQYTSTISSSVQWLKNGIILRSIDNIVIDNTDNTSVLTIMNATLLDNGTYTCSVRNSIGTVNATGTLTIGIGICYDYKIYVQFYSCTNS